MINISVINMEQDPHLFTQVLTAVLCVSILSAVCVYCLWRLIEKISEVSNRLTLVDHRIYQSAADISEKIKVLGVETAEASKKWIESSTKVTETLRQSDEATNTIIKSSIKEVVSSLDANISSLVSELREGRQKDGVLLKDLAEKLNQFKLELNNLATMNKNLDASLSNSTKQISDSIDKLNKVLLEATRI